MSRNSILFIIGLSAWTLVALSTLYYFRSLDIERFFVLFFIGFIFIERWFCAAANNPRLAVAMNVIVGLGTFAYLIILLNKALIIFNA